MCCSLLIIPFRALARVVQEITWVSLALHLSITPRLPSSGRATALVLSWILFHTILFVCYGRIYSVLPRHLRIPLLPPSTSTVDEHFPALINRSTLQLQLAHTPRSPCSRRLLRAYASSPSPVLRTGHGGRSRWRTSFVQQSYGATLRALSRNLRRPARPRPKRRRGRSMSGWRKIRAPYWRSGCASARR